MDMEIIEFAEKERLFLPEINSPTVVWPHVSLIHSPCVIIFDKKPDGSFRGVLELTNVHNCDLAYMIESTDPNLFMISPSIYGVLGPNLNGWTTITITTRPEIKHTFGDVNKSLFLIFAIPVQITRDGFDHNDTDRANMQKELEVFWKHQHITKNSELVFVGIRERHLEYYQEAPQLDVTTKLLSKNFFVRTTLAVKNWFNIEGLEEINLEDLNIHENRIQRLEVNYDILLACFHTLTKEKKLRCYNIRKLIILEKWKRIEACIVAKNFGKKWFFIMLMLFSLGTLLFKFGTNPFSRFYKLI